jgi:hypothetical protein
MTIGDDDDDDDDVTVFFLFCNLYLKSVKLERKN